MSRLINQISAIAPLGDSIDGTKRQPRRLQKLRADPGSPVATRWRCVACGRYAFTLEDGLRHTASELREAIQMLPPEVRPLFVPPPERQRKRQNRRDATQPGIFQLCYSDCPPERCEIHSWGFVVDAGRKFDGRRHQITRAGFRTSLEATAARESLLRAVS